MDDTTLTDLFTLRKKWQATQDLSQKITNFSSRFVNHQGLLLTTTTPLNPITDDVNAFCVNITIKFVNSSFLHPVDEEYIVEYKMAMFDNMPLENDLERYLIDTFRHLLQRLSLHVFIHSSWKRQVLGE